MRKIRYGFTLVLFLALYFTQLLVVSTNQYIFKDEMTQFCYLLPLIVIIFIAVLLISSSIISDSFFCIVYLSMSLYMGFLLYAFQMSILLRLINFFLPLSLLINFIIQYIIPLLICVYGIINALTTRIENINLKISRI